MGSDTLVIMPAYNESAVIGPVIEGLLTAAILADILVINDGSTDDTEQVVSSYPVMWVSHPCNLGYGAALQTGYLFASKMGYRFVVQFDADGQHSVDDLQRLLLSLRSGGSDVVIGTRFGLQRTIGLGWAKQLAINIFRGFIRVCTRASISDPTSGLKGFRNDVFAFYAKRYDYPSDYPDADIIIDILLHGWNVSEIPIGHRARVQGVSMHSGYKPIVYMGKVMMSILAVLVRHQLSRRGAHS